MKEYVHVEEYGELGHCLEKYANKKGLVYFSTTLKRQFRQLTDSELLFIDQCVARTCLAKSTALLLLIERKRERLHKETDKFGGSIIGKEDVISWLKKRNYPGEVLGFIWAKGSLEEAYVFCNRFDYMIRLYEDLSLLKKEKRIIGITIFALLSFYMNKKESDCFRCFMNKPFPIGNLNEIKGLENIRFRSVPSGLASFCAKHVTSMKGAKRIVERIYLLLQYECSIANYRLIHKRVCEAYRNLFPYAVIKRTIRKVVKNETNSA